MKKNIIYITDENNFYYHYHFSSQKSRFFQLDFFDLTIFQNIHFSPCFQPIALSFVAEDPIPESGWAGAALLRDRPEEIICGNPSVSGSIGPG